MASQRVAVIGAGVSGLCAIKSCLEEGLDPVCYEIRNNVGGLWNYSEKVIRGQGSVMHSTVTNVSKEMMSFSDFLMPTSTPNYLRHTEYKKYLETFAEANNLKKYINFETEVLSVNKSDDHERSGKWTVRVKGKNEDDTNVKTEKFDFVMLCTGIHGKPIIPQFPQIEKFAGKVVHAHEVRNEAGFEGKRVVVIGFGNTGGDVSVMLGQVASQVYLSSRSGAWVFGRVNPNGFPGDFCILTRKIYASLAYLPRNLVLDYIEGFSEKMFQNSQFGIQPARRLDQMDMICNDHLHLSILSGNVIVKGDIKEFTKNGVEFIDGTKVADIDAIVMATGYDLTWPLLDKSVTDVQDNKVDLYNYCFPPTEPHHTLAIIGCIQPHGSVPMICELQARYITRVFKKRITLPSHEEMLRSVRLQKEDTKRRYPDGAKYLVRINMLPYLDILAEAVGCKPNLGKMLFTDPSLAWQCFFGPLLPFQYRLTGPGKWDGAREAIMTICDRSLPANKSGSALKSSKSNGMTQFIPALIMFIFPLLIGVILGFIM